MIKKTVLFLVLNFAALAIGGFFTGDGVTSEWYQNLNKAPWTPPGWVFGAAWTSIMILFALYMAFLIKPENRKTIILIYSVQWILNVA
ncbi:MAG: tryptophan-rich sensory protein [Flavobacteriaceae bacterium]|jgi:translocator protein|nr:tryptophan-rich sensory protein [Flavobacteriaceae bacterium]